MELKGANSGIHYDNIKADVAGARGYKATLNADGTVATVAGYVDCGNDRIASVEVDVYTCTEYQIATTATTTTATTTSTTKTKTTTTISTSTTKTSTTTTTTISTTTETATPTTTDTATSTTATATTTTTITTTSTTKTTTTISTTTATATPTTTETETLAVTTPTTTAAEAPLATSNASVGTGAFPGAADGKTSPSPDAARDPKKAVGAETTPPPKVPADGAGASAAANTTADPDSGGTSRNPTTAIVGGVLGSLVLVPLIFFIVRKPAGGKTSIRQNVPTTVENQMYDYTHAALADGNYAEIDDNAGGGAPTPSVVYAEAVTHNEFYTYAPMPPPTERQGAPAAVDKYVASAAEGDYAGVAGVLAGVAAAEPAYAVPQDDYAALEGGNTTYSSSA